MSLFGSLMGDMLENDPIFGSHMRTMRHMNSMMSSILSDPFGDFMGMRDYGVPNLTNSRPGALMPFGGFPPMPNMNRLLSSPFQNPNSHCYSTSTLVSMTSGPDGMPHVYKATSSTRTAPGGVKETQKTISDSRTGTKKMAIGHHIGDRAHIIEREHNVETGDREEREDFINLDEDDAPTFNQEWVERTRRAPRHDVSRMRLLPGRERDHGRLPAITAGTASRNFKKSGNERKKALKKVSHVRKNLVPDPEAKSNSSHPYSPSGHSNLKKNKNIKSVSGSPAHDIVE